MNPDPSDLKLREAQLKLLLPQLQVHLLVLFLGEHLNLLVTTPAPPGVPATAVQLRYLQIRLKLLPLRGEELAVLWPDDSFGRKLCVCKRSCRRPKEEEEEEEELNLRQAGEPVCVQLLKADCYRGTRSVWTPERRTPCTSCRRTTAPFDDQLRKTRESAVTVFDKSAPFID